MQWTFLGIECLITKHVPISFPSHTTLKKNNYGIHLVRLKLTFKCYIHLKYIVHATNRATTLRTSTYNNTTIYRHYYWHVQLLNNMKYSLGLSLWSRYRYFKRAITRKWFFLNYCSAIIICSNWWHLSSLSLVQFICGIWKIINTLCKDVIDNSRGPNTKVWVDALNLVFSSPFLVGIGFH
jgi:hypothetical protein